MKSIILILLITLAFSECANSQVPLFSQGSSSSPTTPTISLDTAAFVNDLWDEYSKVCCNDSSVFMWTDAYTGYVIGEKDTVMFDHIILKNIDLLTTIYPLAYRKHEPTLEKFLQWCKEKKQGKKTRK